MPEIRLSTNRFLKLRCALLLSLAALISQAALDLRPALAAKPQPFAGPWNVTRIVETPTPFVVEKKEELPKCALLSIRHPAEPYQGRATSVFAYLAVPQPLSTPAPAMLLVHGGGGKAFAEWAKLWGERGYVALAMDLAGNGPDGQRLEAGGPPQDDETKFRSFDDKQLTDMWSYQAVAAVLRGHALLAQHPAVDKNRIGITGISWGGYLTSIVAGIDPGLRVAAPVYGCGFLGDNSYWEDAGVFGKMTDAHRQRWLKLFDPSQYLAGVACPILFVNGTNDFAYPLDSYQKSYDLVHAPRTLCVTVNMPHGHEAGWAPAEIGAFVDSVLKQGIPLAKISPLKIDGDQASVRWESATPITNAALHTSADAGPWQQRKWSSVEARLDPKTNTATAKLPPERPLICFITLRDDRGLTVSTEHVELKHD